MFIEQWWHHKMRFGRTWVGLSATRPCGPSLGYACTAPTIGVRVDCSDLTSGWTHQWGGPDARILKYPNADGTGAPTPQLNQAAPVIDPAPYTAQSPRGGPTNTAVTDRWKAIRNSPDA